MPDTEAEKQTGLKDCRKCKYSAECELLKTWELKCRLGVK